MTRPVVVVWFVSLVVMVLGLMLTQHIRWYISDDVTWQSTFMTWGPFNGHVAYTGIKDNFIVNAPLIWLLGKFFSPTRGLLLFESSIFAAINFTLFYIASIYFLKKCKVRLNYITLLPFLWLAGLGMDFTSLFLNTYWRNYEVGVSFLLFMLAAKVYYRELDPLHSWRAVLMSILASFAAGAFIFSDPYFLYFTVIPTVVLYVLLFGLRRIGRREFLLIVGLAALSPVFAKIIKLATDRVGVYIPAGGVPLKMIPLNALSTNAYQSLKDLLAIFGALFAGRPVVSMANVVALLDLLVLVLMVACLVRFWPRRSTIKDEHALEPAKLWVSFFTALCLLTFVAYTMSAGAVAGDYRYFVMFAFAVIPVLCYCISKLHRLRWGAVIVIVLATVVNFGYMVYQVVQYDSTMPPANWSNYALISAVKKLGLTKGYGDYWDGNINTYLSGGSVEFLPVICTSSGKTVPRHLLDDGTLFTNHSPKSFYLVDSDLTDPASCSEQQVLAQFGQPQKQAAVGDKTILIYNHDIAADMP